MKNIKLIDCLNEQLKDTEFKKEWDSLEVEYNSIISLIKNNNETNATVVSNKQGGTAYD